jgi:hypothetical protein
MSAHALTHTKSADTAPQTNSLRVNAPEDSYEREAERAADHATRPGAPKIDWSLSRIATHAPLQRECSCGGTCDSCRKKDEVLQRDATGSHAPHSAPASVHSVLQGAGRPLPPTTRGFMESRFSHDFSRVRIHDDDAAASSARDVAANAYTVGNRIVFNQGRFAPESPRGQRLLAHELAHVVQQTNGPQLVQREGEAEEVAEEGEQEKKSDSVMSRAIRAADARRWEDAARLANGLSPSDLKSFLFIYQKNPEFIKYLHQGALGAPGVGDQSAVALATEHTYKEVKHKEDVAYRTRLARENGTPPPSADGTPAAAPEQKPPTVAEKKQKCQSGETKGIMTFPLRMPKGLFRLSQAPISAHRTGNSIVVSQPLNSVLGDDMFRRETRTLPLDVFTGGLKLAPDDVVRVRVYDDNEKIICVTGEQMLELSKASDNATALAILGTALDAASIMAPGAGQGLSRLAGAGLAGANILANEGLEVARQANAVHYGLQDKIDWAQIGFETLLQAATMGFGGKLTETATEAVAAKVGGTYAREAVKLAVGSVVQGGIQALGAVAQVIFNRQRMQKADMTVGQFVEMLGEAFAQGALFHAVLSQLSHEESGVPGWKGEAAPEKALASGHAEAAPHEEPNARPQHREAAAAPEPRAVPKEKAKATEPIGDGHEAIVTDEGIARCSPGPCPVIPLEYARELKGSKKLQAEYEAVKALGQTDPDAAAKKAASLIRALDKRRKQMSSGIELETPADTARRVQGLPPEGGYSKPNKAGKAKIESTSEGFASLMKDQPAPVHPDAIALDPANNDRLRTEARGAPSATREEQLEGIRMRSEVEDIRAKTPTAKMRELTKKRTDIPAPAVGKPDPANPAEIVTQIEADHVIPLATFYTMEGVPYLDKADIIALGNLPENLVPVSKWVNGRRKDMTYREFAGTPDGKLCDSEYLRKMIELEDALKPVLKEKIQQLGRVKRQAEWDRTHPHPDPRAIPLH